MMLTGTDGEGQLSSLPPVQQFTQLLNKPTLYKTLTTKT